MNARDYTTGGDGRSDSDEFRAHAAGGGTHYNGGAHADSGRAQTRSGGAHGNSGVCWNSALSTRRGRSWATRALCLVAALGLIAGACSSGDGDTSAPPPEQEGVAVEEPTPPPTTAASATTTTAEATTTTAAPATEATTTTTAATESPSVADDLQEELDRLVAVAAEWDAAAEVALAVITSDGEEVGANSDLRHSSASAVKPLWVAAAMSHEGVEAVQPLVEGTLVRSDNIEAGKVIDLIGVEAVNAWSSEVAELSNTRLLAWRFGGVDRRAPEIAKDQPAENFSTTSDLARFYARLRQGELLEPSDTATLTQWLTNTSSGPSDDEIDGAIIQRLPSDMAGDVSHKAGWLTPYCCEVEVRQIIDAGIIPLPDDDWFSIAVLSRRGEHYDISLQWVALAGCSVYALLSGTDLDCGRAGDGVADPTSWPEPTTPVQAAGEESSSVETKVVENVENSDGNLSMVATSDVDPAAGSSSPEDSPAPANPEGPAPSNPDDGAPDSQDDYRMLSSEDIPAGG